MSVNSVCSLGHGLLRRPIFLSSVAVGLAITYIIGLLTDYNRAAPALIGWDGGVCCYLILWAWRFWYAEDEDIQTVAKKLDEGKWLMILLVIAAVGMCLIAIIGELGHLSKNSPHMIAHVILSIITLILSWLLVHTTFAIHYAHDFYNNIAKHKEGGLDFPKTTRPTYPDFIYFSFIIGTSSQTADVSITDSATRLLNIIHCLLAFAFNTSILAIMINVVASLFTGSE